MQLKSRWPIDKKYLDRDLWIALPMGGAWYLMPHEKMVALVRQRHTARYQGQDVTIHYPFHPRYGERVGVVRRHRLRGEVMLVVEQPDGTVTHVPEWMTTPAAGNASLCDALRFPLGVLQELRLTTDAALSLLRERRNGGRYETPQSDRATRPVHADAADDCPPAGGSATAAATSGTAPAGGAGERNPDNGGE
ncbi:hypothetical protein M5E06_31055 [Azospirillum sp. A1-3]|uniref:hypothetical protein n=1 Tax=Azospirillum sp. A1-3 TaxID=185874 RepID=UPI0020775E7C|nr:hypothetical protein [Azospirillum sp. A1-3]MCM8738561.1 hypothetical protein [Azospirillum sp. A1-3]